MRKTMTILGAGLMLVVGGSSLAAERTGLPTVVITVRADSSHVVQQFERMTDDGTGQKLFYRAVEIADIAGLSRDKVLAAIEAGSLCSIKVDGVALVPANFVGSFLTRTAVQQRGEQIVSTVSDEATDGEVAAQGSARPRG